MSLLVRKVCMLFAATVMSACLSGQSLHRDLTYFLPDITYDSSIPSPESFLGHQVGEWHLSHDKIYGYMQLLAEASDRVSLVKYARSHEYRPLVYLTITSATNHNRIESIKKGSVQLTSPEESNKVDLTNQPAILYQGYSVHGNESSGANASVLVAYYLAAGKDEHVKELLDNTVILLDPCYNPDGLQRFSTWANSHKGTSLISDSRSREYNEVWPGGRTNHYWFDLNRDWLLTTHPESKGRLHVFHEWKPNILTDHHEMGTNSTFFFQPGVPSRTNPNTPQLNQQLTEEIGEYHAEALDAIGSQYYTKASFDDFYYGKGSTYPDIHGAIGILFEQASSRGHYQESNNGIVDFPFTIRNQVVTSLSTQKALLQMKDKLLTYKRDFFKDQHTNARSTKTKAILIADEDHSKLDRFVEILHNHDIEVCHLEKEVKVNGVTFAPKSSYIIPTEQSQYGLIKTMFEKVTTFNDSIFYDVSAWTMPLAFDLTYGEFQRGLAGVKGSKVESKRSRVENTPFPKSNYGYAFEWKDFYSPTALTKLLDKEVNAKVITQKMTLQTDAGAVSFSPGSIFIPLQSNRSKLDVAHAVVKSVHEDLGVRVYSIKGGSGQEGFATGDPSLRALEALKPFMIVGDGVSAYDAGEVWYYMDKILQTPITMIDQNDLTFAKMNRYNTLVLPHGSYGSITEQQTEKIKKWISQGGQVIAMRGGVEWLRRKGLVNLKVKTADKEDKTHPVRNYTQINKNRGSKVLGGSIFDARIELTHPFAYGYDDDNLPTFRRGTTFYENPENLYSTPLWYADKPLLSGYMPRGVEDLAKGSPVATLHRLGQGRLTCFSDNLLFRGYWWGTHRLMANALYFTQILDRQTLND